MFKRLILLFAVFLLVLGFASAQSSNSLILHYSFDDGTASDVSGNNNDGFLIGATSQQGMYEQGISLDGSSDYVNTSFQPSLDDFTLSTWIRPDSLEPDMGGGQRIISAQSATTTDNLLLLRLEGSGGGCSQGTVSFSIEEGDSGVNTVCSNQTISTDSWYHVVGVREGNELKVYINGVLSGTTQNVDTVALTPDAPFEVGRLEGGREHFGGMIDEVRIYNRSLSTHEIQNIYDSSNTLSFVMEDVNRDGSVNVQDLVAIATNIGSSNASYDINDDNTVNIFDLVDVVRTIVSGSDTTDTDGDGVIASNDCDDNNASVQDTITCNYDGNSCGTYDLCRNSCPTPPNEVCGDAVDNDCDGNIDEGCSTNDTVSGAHANEPLGYGQIGHHNFTSEEEDGWNYWDESGNDDYSIVSDSTAPQSPSNVGRIRWQAGDGSGPNAEIQLNQVDYNVENLYVEFWFKPSENWQGHNSAVNKIFYIGADSGDQAGIKMMGVDNSSMQLSVFNQGLHIVDYEYEEASNGDSNEVSPTREEATLTRGEWHHVEVILRGNTPGQEDGELHAWIDGTKILQYTSNVGWLENSTDGRWDNVRWDPYWGGGGDTVEEEMYQYMDEIYVSGANDTNRESNESLSHTHEPSGMTASYVSHFNTENIGEGDPPEDWGSFDRSHECDGNNTHIVQDSTAPASPPNVGMVEYCAGFDAGSTPGGWGGGPTGQHSTLYAHFWMKYSPNWEHQPSADKINYITDSSLEGNAAPAFFASRGGGWKIQMQGGGDGSPAAYEEGGQYGILEENVGNVPPNQHHGEWMEVEMILRMNTPGTNHDGEAHVWVAVPEAGVNKTKVIEYTDVNWENDDNTLNGTPDYQWDGFNWAPYWGGGAGTIDETQYAYMDYMYVSGN